MQIIKRDLYLNKLINRKENKMIKIITGIRRCGKSFLLNPIFSDYLKSIGVSSSHIIKIDLDYLENKKYHNPMVLYKHLKKLIKDKKIYYIMLDEIQLVDDFEMLLNSLSGIGNTDIYVTGSNSKFLSSDIITEFRGRGDEIKVYPLSFAEFLSTYTGTQQKAWEEYVYYGGMPLVLYKKTIEEKVLYLNELFQKTYITDIINRNNIKRNDILDSLINILSSSIGSLTNIKKITDTFKSNGVKEISINTISSYINYLTEAFLLNKVERYDVKGRKYISSQAKYYFADIGLRNVRIGFRQTEENHLMENIIYNELLVRGYNVDVGIVEYNTIEKNKKIRKQLEVDFVCNKGSKRYYIQSAFAIPDEEKMKKETNSLTRINDSFKKIVVVKDSMLPIRVNNEGITIINIKDFLLNSNSLDL